MNSGGALELITAQYEMIKMIKLALERQFVLGTVGR
jgi:hypothetical protein